MPLSELPDLGYEIDDRPELLGTTLVRGHDREWVVLADATEQEIEAIVTEAVNYAKLTDKLAQAHDYFRDNYTGWGSLTAPQKDAANRQAQRALANLIGYVRNDLSSEGI